ncbi:MAG: Na+/H+ antiporter NhaA [Actinomycetota bacterium]|jgi:Na+:H+ antiporter, NhaA family
MKTDSDTGLVSDDELRHGPRRPWLGPHRPLLQRWVKPVIEVLHVEAAGGVALLVAAVAALVWANSPWQGAYESLWATEAGIRIGGFQLSHDLRHWVNDGLMVLFFFVVGLEIKTELVAGELADRRRAALPIAAAAGGMVVPAVLYVMINVSGGALRGWGVPVATDIAFAVGVVALLGRRVPQSLKIFLLALAIVDDIGAILVIAVFYTDNLALGWLAMAAGLVGAVALMRWLRIWYGAVYVAAGFAIWLATHESGVHATVAGVALGLLAPARPLVTREQLDRLAAIPDTRPKDGGPEEPRDVAFLVRESESVAERLQDALHPWTSYVVIPLFALANAGVTIERQMISDAATSPVTLGVMAGLVVGKPLGVLAGAWLAVRFRAASLPSGVNWRQVGGVGAVAGIGFTMSLFIAGLAFGADAGAFEQAKLGIFAASLVAACIGAVILRRQP